MKLNKNIPLLKIFGGYLQFGAVALLVAWIAALLATVLLPSPFYFDFFGIVAESTNQGSSVTIGSEALFSAFILLPLVIAAVDYFNKKKRR